jgi:hypothetical protein
LAADWEVGVTLFHSLGIVAYSGVSAAAPGMVLMKPTSIAYSGTSATLGANGQVTFSAVTSLSLNGCFTADFDNYVISFRSLTASSNITIVTRLRASGSDNSTSNYADQYLVAGGTTVSAARTTGATYAGIVESSATQRSGATIYMYGPALAQPTAYRSINISGASSAYLAEFAGTHNVSSSFDGITFQSGAIGVTGALQVYGVRS